MLPGELWQQNAQVFAALESIYRCEIPLGYDCKYQSDLRSMKFPMCSIDSPLTDKKSLKPLRAGSVQDCLFWNFELLSWSRSTIMTCLKHPVCAVTVGVLSEFTD